MSDIYVNYSEVILHLNCSSKKIILKMCLREAKLNFSGELLLWKTICHLTSITTRWLSTLEPRNKLEQHPRSPSSCPEMSVTLESRRLFDGKRKVNNSILLLLSLFLFLIVQEQLDMYDKKGNFYILHGPSFRIKYFLNKRDVTLSF